MTGTAWTSRLVGGKLPPRPETERVPLDEAIAITRLTEAQLLDGLSGGARSAAINDGIPAARIADYLLRECRTGGVAQDVPASSAPKVVGVLRVLEKDNVGHQMLLDLAGPIGRLARLKTSDAAVYRQVVEMIEMADEYVQIKKLGGGPGKAPRGLPARRRLSAKPTDPKEPP